MYTIQDTDYNNINVLPYYEIVIIVVSNILPRKDITLYIYMQRN